MGWEKAAHFQHVEGCLLALSLPSVLASAIATVPCPTDPCKFQHIRILWSREQLSCLQKNLLVSKCEARALVTFPCIIAPPHLGHFAAWFIVSGPFSVNLCGSVYHLGQSKWNRLDNVVQVIVEGFQILQSKKACLSKHFNHFQMRRIVFAVNECHVI